MQSVISYVWHPKLNQIFLGCADGNVQVFYSERHSVRYSKLLLLLTQYVVPIATVAKLVLYL